MVRLPIVILALGIAAPVAIHAAPSAIRSYVTTAVADPARPAAERDTDANRKPAETLVFAGVKPGMTVGEFYPGGGYFTRMLSRVVGPRGHVYGIENDRWKGAVKADDALLADGKYANVSIAARPFGTVDFPKPLDLAWVTQNYHDLKIAQFGVVDTIAFDRGVFAALKPGGIFFILDHEALPGTDDAAIAKLHRIERIKVIREVTSVGFKLVDEGNFLRRPSDDHTLPIFDKKVQGHTDQYALKFVKPIRP
ncbi:MAG: class I SAM-dependent methyltransferase [Sphingomonas sp.]|uniref:class I SAM-dependent methyltransferase n=1 Tax=Sphingomonas sp. TaxID=28214 RepID=UPI001ACBA96A|nr:methyltransferase [Sphingomonas sp.]MBN8807447.1 class I SAM-dependent methyltransferase [Sphingomonas sp.]